MAALTLDNSPSKSQRISLSAQVVERLPALKVANGEQASGLQRGNAKLQTAKLKCLTEVLTPQVYQHCSVEWRQPNKGASWFEVQTALAPPKLLHEAISGTTTVGQSTNPTPATSTSVY